VIVKGKGFANHAETFILLFSVFQPIEIKEMPEEKNRACHILVYFSLYVCLGAGLRREAISFYPYITAPQRHIGCLKLG